jgi:hypothetical protein
MKNAKMLLHIEYFMSPMVHPVTEQTISSYKQLVNGSATAKVWQTEFGRDFGGMAQVDNKTGQNGKNAMFVMTRNKIAHALGAKTFFTYRNPVINNRPQRRSHILSK